MAQPLGPPMPQPEPMKTGTNYGEPPPPYGGQGPMSPMYPPPGQAYPPPGQAYPPPGQTYPPPGQAYPQIQAQTPATSSTTVVMMPGAQPQPQGTAIVLTGNCPRCHNGILITENSPAMCIVMIILAILFFPIGLLYLLCIPKELRCPQCGYTSG